MRFVKLFLPAVISLLLLSGCLSTGDNAAEQELQACRQCGEKLIHAFLKGDEKAFFAQLPPGVSAHYGPKELAKNRAALFREFGEVDSVRYLTSLETPSPLHTLVWVVRFRRSPVLGEEKIYQEILCRVVVGKADERYQIYSFAF